MAKKITAILGLVLLILSSALLAEGLCADENVKAFLAELESAVYRMDTYSCVMASEYWRGSLHEKKKTLFQFKKPNLMRMDVLEGKKKGSAVVLDRKGRIRGRNSWGLSKTLKPTDGRIKNIRGDAFMQASLLNKLERLKEHILERGCDAVLTEEKFGGVLAYRLHIGHRDTDGLVTAEDILFDKKTYATLKNLKYEGKVKVSDIIWERFEINPPLDDSLFEL